MYSSCSIETPVGTLIAVASPTHLVMLEFADSKSLEKKLLPILGGVRGGTLEIPRLTSPTRGGIQGNEILQKTVLQLDEYFAGKRKTFNIPLAPSGTPFQKQAWNALEKIPYGETRSYQEEATMIGNPKAVRAIGGANNKNPIVIIVPCHRVIGKNGSLVGYGGGMEHKVWLLEHERQK